MGTRIFACHPGEAVVEASPTELPALMDEAGVFVWVSLDQQGPRHTQILTDVLKLHPLLVEDALDVAPTPKVETHEGYTYLILHGLRNFAHEAEHGHEGASTTPGQGGAVETVDVDFFLGPECLVTHHRLPMPSLDAVRRAVVGKESLLQKGPAYVAHELIDRMVDEYLPMMERLDKEVVRVERAALKESDPKLLESIFELKHALQGLRRIGIHQREILHGLGGDSYEHIPDGIRRFFRDVDDHFVRVMDLNESYRDLVASSLDAYLSMQSHRLNEVMKILTVISTIMLPLTFITGLYGMNFDEMPLIHWQYGYETAWAVMIATAAIFFWAGRRRRWI
ncbi:MAG: magnesium/cobalt transporter CorA [Polyangiales bacterium]